MKQLLIIFILLLSSFQIRGQKRFSKFDSLDECKNWSFELEFDGKLSSINSDTILAIKYSYFHSRIKYIGVICWKVDGKYNFYTIKEISKSNKRSYRTILKFPASINNNLKRELINFFEKGIELPTELECNKLEIYIDGEGGGFDGAGGGEIFIKSRINDKNFVFENEENQITGCKPLNEVRQIVNLCDLLKIKEMRCKGFIRNYTRKMTRAYKNDKLPLKLRIDKKNQLKRWWQI